MKKAKPPQAARSKKSGNEKTATSDSSVATDAIALLKADHRTVEKLFKDYEDADDDAAGKQKIAQQVCLELIIHAKIEEEIFYRACREAGVEDDLLQEAQVEHDTAKILIGELLSSDDISGPYDAKVKVLAEYIKHHVGEEEKSRNGIFAKAKKADLDMAAIGARLQERKTELTAEGESLVGEPLQLASLQLNNLQPISQEHSMPRNSSRDRDSNGRFMSDDDDDNRQSSRSGNQSGRTSGSNSRNDDARYGRSSSGDNQDRDGRGRFTSDDDDDNRSSRGRGYSSRSGQDDDEDDYSRGRSTRSSRDDDDDSNRSRNRSSQSQYGRSNSGNNDRDRDDQGRFMSDDDNHSSSRNARGNNDEDDDDYGDNRSSRSRYSQDDEQDDRSSNQRRSSGNTNRGGANDDSRSGSGRSSQSSRSGSSQGRDSGRSSQGGNRSSSSQGEGRSESEGHGGWFGDHRGHSQAAKRGWQHRGE